ncbi:MAG: phosphoglucosamine mutase, partial [Desulfobacterales bacterium]|nr:phosphoglucosamine mutase [Desulfobacterales bacterium]
MKTLFGTDGMRGVANEYPMTSEMVVKIGRAVAYFFQKKNTRSKIIV